MLLWPSALAGLRSILKSASEALWDRIVRIISYRIVRIVSLRGIASCCIVGLHRGDCIVGIASWGLHSEIASFGLHHEIALCGLHREIASCGLHRERGFLLSRNCFAEEVICWFSYYLALLPVLIFSVKNLKALPFNIVQSWISLSAWNRTRKLNSSTQ